MKTHSPQRRQSGRTTTPEMLGGAPLPGVASSESARSGQAKRRPSAVLAVDVVNYVRLMERSEEATHQRIMELFAALLKPHVAMQGGRIIKNTGDGFLATFDTAAQAGACALAIQQAMLQAERDAAPDVRIWLRMGLNLCETIFEKDDVYGEGVNVAARLQAYAEPGDIVVSLDALAGMPTPGVPIADLGELHLKNMSRAVRAFTLRIGSMARRLIPAARAIDRLPSIAVLPFRMHPADPAENYFAEGMVAEVIRALSGLREIFVISHSSTLTYANQAVDVRTVGRELGVRYIVTGVIERNSSRIRLATELSDAKSGAVMSTGRYEGAVADLFAFQDQLAMRVVADIEPRVKEWELRQTLRKRGEDLDAYDLTLRGLSLLSRLDYDAFSQARGLLQQAIVLDPDYSVPYAHAAHWHIFRVGQGWSPDPAADGAEGRRLAATAVDLDHENAPALAILGHTNSFILRQPEVGLNYFGRALDASPNCAMAWALSSATHSYLGRGADAVTQAEQALRLSPRDIHAFYYQTALTLAHYTSGNHEAAVASGLRAVSQNPAFCTNLRHTAASLAALGRLDEARRIADLHARAQPGFTLKRFEQSCPYQRDQAAIFLDHLRQAGFPN